MLFRYDSSFCHWSKKLLKSKSLYINCWTSSKIHTNGFLSPHRIPYNYIIIWNILNTALWFLLVLHLISLVPKILCNAEGLLSQCDIVYDKIPRHRRLFPGTIFQIKRIYRKHMWYILLIPKKLNLNEKKFDYFWHRNNELELW